VRLPRALAAAVAAFALVLAACGGADAELTVEGAWVRSNPNLIGAAYLAITSPVADELVAASVDPSIAGSVEVHEVALDDGMMRMREVTGIALPAGETVLLEPGGYHLMLLDMPAVLPVGTTVDITLTFASGTTRTVSAEVRESTVPEDHMHGHGTHGEHGHGEMPGEMPGPMPGGHGHAGHGS
jgi:copper(I)-binding protein